MANRRMFSREIVDTDRFLDMPSSTRLLYYDLGMRADDDGFLQDARKIIRITGASWGDMQTLIERAFVIPFESGVIVIRHWRNNNQIRVDRYKPTVCVEEKSTLTISQSGSYERLPDGCQVVANLETQVRIVESKKEKEKIDKGSVVYELPPHCKNSNDTSELSDQITNHQHAEDLIRRYRLPDGDPTMDALLEDADTAGWERVEDALKKAAISNTRQRISIKFYRLFLNNPTPKGSCTSGSNPYEGYSTI